MKYKTFFLMAIGALIAGQALAVEHESKRLGLRYRHPDNFVVGELKKEPNAEVLIERRLAKGQDLKDVHLRGELSVIQLTRSRGEEADFIRHFLLKEPLRQSIGSWVVYVLPGYPGPYGDKALYYLVPLKDGSILEIVAPKSYLEDSQQEQPTHYDTVIRGLIESLTVTE
jgi:hypothetical protein